MVGYVIFFICTVDLTCLLFSYTHLFSSFVPQAKERKKTKTQKEREREEAKTRREKREMGKRKIFVKLLSLSFVFLFKSHLERERENKRQCYHTRVLFCLADFAQVEIARCELEILEDTWGLKLMESLSSILAYQARLKVSAIMQYSPPHSLHLHKIRGLKCQLKTVTNFPPELPGYGKNQKWTFEVLKVLLGRH